MSEQSLDTSTAFGRAVLAARLAQDKLAQDVLLLEMSSVDGAPADVFVLASVQSDAQMQAVTSAITRAMKDLGMGSARPEGGSSSPWTVIDYFDVVIHVMTHEARDFYRIEKLWGDAAACGLDQNGDLVPVDAVRTKRSGSL